MNKKNQLFLILCFFLLAACVQVNETGSGSTAPFWTESPQLDVAVRGRFTVLPGVAGGSPAPEVAYYYAAEGMAMPEAGFNEDEDWLSAEWKLVEDIASPVIGLKNGNYLLVAVASNVKGVVRSPRAEGSIVEALSPTAWSNQPSVDTGQAGMITIVPPVAIGGDPLPEYDYYIGRKKLDPSIPPEGEDTRFDWLYEGWEYVGTSGSDAESQKSLAGIQVQAHEYTLYAVAHNGGPSALRSNPIPFEVTGFKPEWQGGPQITPSDIDMGVFALSEGDVLGNPTPDVVYYLASRGKAQPSGSSATDWIQWQTYSFDSSEVQALNGEVHLDVGFYDLYAVASNKYEPPALIGPFQVNLEYLAKNIRRVQTSVPTDWQDSTKPDLFGCLLYREDGAIVLTGGEFAQSYISTDGGASWTKQTGNSGLQGIYWGVMVEYNGAVYHLGGSSTAIPSDNTTTALNAVYKSEDGGITFTKLYDAPWPARFGFTAIPFNGKIWLMGGGGDGIGRWGAATLYIARTDIWNTIDIEDKDAWTKKTDNAPWKESFNQANASYADTYNAMGADAVVYQGQLYYGAGSSYNVDGAIWKTSDGESWSRITAARPSESGVHDFPGNLFVFKNRIWVLWMSTQNILHPWSSDDVHGGILYYINPGSEQLVQYLAVKSLSQLGLRSLTNRDDEDIRHRMFYVIPWEGEGDEGIRIVSMGHWHALETNNREISYKQTDSSALMYLSEANFGRRVVGLKWLTEPEN
ncbi:MAG: hypothetical protein B0D92_07230 [Spirochaeta sp. LUC14_002_19_P3]|nr:MAG: hypothetical protein B0D92_07230 [Spirochaeta sp. LUC14_002_19_P3]